MTKVIQCKNLFPGCDFTAEAETEEELLQEAAEHATAAHGITEMKTLYFSSPPATNPRMAIRQGLSGGRRPILARAALGAFLIVLGPTLLLASHALAQEWKSISPEESKIGFVGGPLAGAQPNFAQKMKAFEYEGEFAAFQNANAMGQVVHLKITMTAPYVGWRNPNAKTVINNEPYFQENEFKEKYAGRASVNGFQSQYAVLNVKVGHFDPAKRPSWQIDRIHECVAFDMTRGDHKVRGFLCGAPNETMTKNVAVDWLREIKVKGAIGP